ncbi:myb-related protein Myb4-like [Hibiscus syriacus]|uniref:Myb-related protein Myb4-like n=1 Tax=Hibiscus syriacus TaxID=106335 RepID=A0A6A3ATY1_HIBSY|nr:uncharacterized protein LOC120123654 [Hibiscus syriacus]KAE8706352.1 myb-related protein Myb4-like [Hibiscus syriacus]
MPATDYQASFLGRISLRRNQVIAMDGNHEQEDLELFSKHVSERFTELLSPPDDVVFDTLLSISWLRKLLDVFLCCEAEFKAVLMMGDDDHPFQISKPPLDRLIHEFLDRSIKALDLCNAVTNGLDSVRHYQKLAEIAASALGQKPIGDGQARRSRKALNSLLMAMSVDDKECSAVKTTERSWSFSRLAVNKDRSPGHLRQVAKKWSAAKQIQAMTWNLVPPRGAEGSGLASPVYTMSVIMVFVMWALAAAIPCQERNGLSATYFPVRKQWSWDQSITGLHEKIAEEWKEKEKKGAAGLLSEVQKMEKLVRNLMEFTDSFQFHGGTDEKAEEAADHAAELAEICKRMEEGLLPLQMKIKEVFHRIVRSRAEFLQALKQGGKSSAPPV